MTLLLAIATAIGAGAVGGVYLAFAVMVMPALGRLPARDATAAMQEINRRAERGAFIGVFLFAALVALALGIVAITALPDGAAMLLLVGAALSLASAVVTVVGNVPLNNRLEREGAPFWETYRSR
ncbi:MAG: anthrone oxygenase family protein [Glaciihabitans sp.]